MLEKLGLEKDWIYEVLMETKNPDSSSNLAPIGIWTDDFDFVLVDIYNEAKTYKNLARSGEGKIYFVRDPKFFVENNKVPWDAKIDFKVARAECKNPCRFYLKITDSEIRKQPELINRAKSLFVEFLIDYSRKDGDESARARLDYYQTAISKVAPGSEYEKLIQRVHENKD